MMEGFGLQADKALLDTVFDGIVVVELKHLRISLANKAAADILGFDDPDDLVGVDPLKHVSSEDRDGITSILAGLVSGSGLQAGAEIRVLDKRGRDVWIMARGVKLASNGNSVLLASFRDITAQKTAEIARREAEKSQIDLLNASNELILISQDWKVVFANRSLQEAMGMSAEALVGMSILDLTHPDDREAVRRRYAQMLEGKYLPSGRAFKGIGKDGRTSWGMMRHVPFTWQGKPALMTIVRDITQQRLAEEALQDSERRYRLMADNITDVIWALDMNFKTIYVSPSVMQQKGYTVEEAMNLTLEEQMSPDAIAQIVSTIEEEMVLEASGSADPHRSRTAEGETFRKDGSKYWVEITASFMRDQQGKPIGFMGITRDITERKKAEELLRASEEKFRLLTEKTNDIIWTTDLNLRPTYLSPSIEKVLGFTPEERLKQNVADHMTPASYARVRGRLEEELKREEEGHYDPERTIRIETEYYHKNGSTVWMENLVSALRDETGRIVGVHGVSRDVTERRKAEEGARLAAQQWRETFDSITDMVSIHDLDFNVVRANKAFAESLGMAPNEIKGRKCYEMVHGTAAPWPSCPHEQCLKRGKPCTEEVWEPRLSKCLHVSVSPLFNNRGEIVGSVHIARDITERKKTEDALRDSERRYRLLAENVEDVIYATDLKLKLSYVSPSVVKLLGYRPEEVLQTGLDKLVAPASLEAGMKVVGEHFAREAAEGSGSGGVWTVELELMRKDGGTVWVEVTTNFVRGEEGQATGLTGVVRDISERKKAQEAIKESEVKYRNLFEHTLLGMEVVDGATGKVVLANHFMARMFGFKSPEDIVGTNPLDYVLPEDLEWVTNKYAKMLTTSEIQEPATLRARTEDGRIIWVRGTSTSFEYEGRPSALISLIEVTAAKEAEDKLRDSEEKNRLLIDNAAEAIAVVQDGLLKFANRKFAESVGYSAEELISRSFADFIHPDDLPRIADYYVKRLQGEEAPSKYQFRWIDREGTAHWGEASIAVFKWEDRPATLCMLTDITDRKRAENALRDSENRYRLMAENASDVIWTMDMNFRRTYLSPSIEKLTGYSVEEAISMNIEDGLTPASLETAMQSFSEGLKALETNEAKPNAASTVELEMKCKDGSTVWTEAQMSFLRDSEGKVFGVMGVARDINERRRARKAVEESEERYRLIAENSSDVIWTMDMDLRMTYVSPSIERLTGYTAEESLLMTMENGLTPASLEAASEVFARGMTELERNGGKPISPETVELEMKRKDGSTVWTEVHMSFMQDSRDRVVGIMGVARNVNERRRARKALEESEERFRALIEGARDAIAVIDLNGKVTYRSPSAERITDGAVENLLTVSLQERLHPDDVARATDLFTSLVRNPGGSVVDVELRYRREDGSWGVVEARGTNWTHDPKIGGIVVNYRDITDRRLAEEALRESESRHRLLAENVSDVIWSLNMRTKRVFFSPSVTRLLGYTIEEAQTVKMKQVVSPTSIPKAMMCFSNLLGKTGNGSGGRSSSTQLEVELMRKDGSLIWVDVAVTLLRDAEGQPAELFGVMRDITQRRRVEEDLRTSEEYFRALIENAWDAIVIVDANGTMLYESPSSARILGYEPKEIVGKSLVEFVRPEDIAANVEMFRKFRTEPGSIVMVDASFKHKDGHYIECEGTLQNFLHDLKINGIVVNYRDVTDRRRAEEAIRSSEERFRNLVEATSDFVWEVDPSGIYTYVSPRVHEVMGYEVGEIIGKSMFDHMPARDSSRLARTFRAHAEKKEPFAFMETSRQRKDGKVIVMETSGVPFLDSDGNLLGYRGIGRDITSRKKVERDLENSLKKVEKTMEAAIQAISYTMETRDPYTTGHQRRVTQLACAIAKEMGVAAWQIDGIRVAGLLHDIGKIAVPTEILSKPGKLSDIEFSMIKAHPKVGFDILKNVEFEWPIARIVVQHHERLDGSGYPFGLRGKDILQESRILAVADVVEAMSSHRPYRPALGIDKALAEVVRGEGTLYDTNVVRACARVIKERAFKFEG